MTSARARPSLHPQPGCGRVRQRITRRRRLLTALLVGVAAAGLPSPVVASSGGGRRITDAENTRTVYLVVTALVVLAVGLAVFTWWFWRSTRRDHEALAPLEVMTDRKFLASDAVARQVLLDGNRPVGAAPLAPGAPEPLLIPVDEQAADADDAPATLVLAAVGASDAAASATASGDAAIASGRTDPTVTTNGDATTVVGEQASGTDDVGGALDGDVVAPAEAPTPAHIGVDGDDEGRRGDSAADSDATMAIAATAADAQRAAAFTPAEVPAPASSADDASQHPGDEARPPRPTNGSPSVPIDPGLHVPRPDDEPVRQLSLADLVALNADAPVSFDEDELASTPSTGIPVIESAEAWVERQLTASTVDTMNVNGEQSPDTAADGGDDLEGADPDEASPAAVRGAE